MTIKIFNVLGHSIMKIPTNNTQTITSDVLHLSDGINYLTTNLHNGNPLNS